MQFNLGESLNPVKKLLNGRKIEYAVVYFSGGIFANNAKKSGMTLADADLLDEAIISNKYLKLYIKPVYSSSQVTLGYFDVYKRDLLNKHLKHNEKSNCTCLKLDNIINQLNTVKDYITMIYVYWNPSLQLMYRDQEIDSIDKIGDIFGCDVKILDPNVK